MNLNEFGELNQSQLMSYCGLNNVQHRPIIDELVEKGLIIRFEEPWGEHSKIIKYKVSEKGRGNSQSDIRALRAAVSKERGEEMKTGNTVTALFVAQWWRGYTNG